MYNLLNNFRGSFNLTSRTLRDANLSDSCTSDRCCFSILVGIEQIQIYPISDNVTMLEYDETLWASFLFFTDKPSYMLKAYQANYLLLMHLAKGCTKRLALKRCGCNR